MAGQADAAWRSGSAAAISSAHELTGELIGHFQQAVAAGQIWRSER